MKLPRTLTAVLDAAERSGKLNLSLQALRAALPGTSAAALRQALHRQQRRGRLVRLSRGSGHWLLVPLQHAGVGAPPLEAWLDRYLSQTLALTYYVALLSAAESYGAAPYAVLVTQVMVVGRRRPISVGRHRLEFFTRTRLERVPTRWHETPDGRFRVATPEVTALELVERAMRVGGISRVREVLRALWPSCTEQGLAEALDALEDVPNAQRLGALLALEGPSVLTARVESWLQGRPHRLVALERGGSLRRRERVDRTFKVRLPATARGANA